MGRVQRNLVGFLAAVAGAVLGACSHSASVVNPFTNHHAAARAAPGSGAQQGPADLVSAVSLSGSGDKAVSLKLRSAAKVR